MAGEENSAPQRRSEALWGWSIRPPLGGTNFPALAPKPPQRLIHYI